MMFIWETNVDFFLLEVDDHNIKWLNKTMRLEKREKNEATLSPHAYTVSWPLHMVSRFSLYVESLHGGHLSDSSKPKTEFVATYLFYNFPFSFLSMNFYWAILNFDSFNYYYKFMIYLSLLNKNCTCTCLSGWVPLKHYVIRWVLAYWVCFATFWNKEKLRMMASSYGTWAEEIHWLFKVLNCGWVHWF